MSDETYTLSARAAEFYESTFVPALFQDWARQLIAFADPGPGQRVLDVACGTGVVARELAGVVAEVTGVDRNPAMLDVARRLGPGVTWREGDAAALPFPDGTFDLVVCQAALMFFPDRTAALREMARVSTVDAQIVLQVPGRLSHSAGYTALARAVRRYAGERAADLLGAYFACGDPVELRALVADAGLTVARFETWTGATRLASVEEFIAVELLPIADEVAPDVRERLQADAARELAPFIDPTGAIAAPIEVQLVAAVRGGGAR